MSDGIWVSGRLLSSQSYVDLKAAVRVISLRREEWLLFLAGPARLNMANSGVDVDGFGKGLSGRGRPRQACSGSCQTKDRPATNESEFLFWTDGELGKQETRKEKRK